MKYTITFIMIVILLIILIINSLFAPKIREYFVSGDEKQPLKSINLCGRNLVFPYFANNDFTASQRALKDTSSLQTSPVGLCRINSTNGLVNESHSIVHENSLFYNLKQSCLALRVTGDGNGVSIENDIVYVSFMMENETDLNNLTIFMLLNPLYVEFSIDSAHDTSGYRIAHEMLQTTAKPTWIFSNVKQLLSNNIDNNKIRIPFKSISEANKGSCDKVFNYGDLSKNQKLITGADMTTINREQVINMRVFYLEKLSSSFQSIGRSLNLTLDPSGKVNIFEKDYQKYVQTQQDKYEFMNNIALMYSNYVYPVMTFEFDINVTRNSLSNNQMLCKVYMKNSLGNYPYCNNINDISDVKNNNIFASSFEPSDNDYYRMLVFIGKDGNCNSTNTNTLLSVTLPYLAENNNIQISLTITPNERIILARWLDTNSRYVNKRYVYGRKNECGQTPYDICVADSHQDSVVDNNLYNLFVRNSGTSRISLENIEMAYNLQYMKTLKSCTLGYINLLNNL